MNDTELKEREDYMREMAKEVWPVIKNRIGITWRVKCPPVIVTRRLVRSRGGRYLVQLSLKADERVLVHELLHSAMMMMPGAIKTTRDGRRIHHSSRMRFLERTVCKELGFQIGAWASGEPYSSYHRNRQQILKETQLMGCWKCKGELEKVGALARFGTTFRCKVCGYKFWV